ncbi:metallophosphoesterase [Ruminococcus flavefaciens]|uniref:metallophosphoesterase n=1 Tax=Ruminococcus flavefaciens TaxID=1265 RepID=UPI0004662A5C|nr:metallophosphoesterase [Ruminococcus flavefaciens]
MTMWLIILVAVLAAFAAGTVYLTVAVGRFGLIKKLSGDRKWLKGLLSFGIIAIVFTGMVFLTSVVNAIIILLSTLMFFLIYGLVFRIIRAVRKKDFTCNWAGRLALVTSAVYLCAGCYLCFHIWQKNYHLTTDKFDGKLRIAMFADSHLCTTFDGDGFAEQMERIKEQSPDILFIAGDFVDDSTDRENMIKACAALGDTELKYGVWYCYGNHDKSYYGSERRGFSKDDLEAELEKNGVHVLEDESLTVGGMTIIGRKDSAESDRAEMSELMKNVSPDSYTIVLDHEPNDYDNEAAANADLVLSGHTHGGQLFPVTYVGEWFRINDATYGYERRKNTDFIVTSGISDWEILFKTGTKSEYVIIDIN